jgi:RNase adaptor protein for sRNA GlmZ degradation
LASLLYQAKANIPHEVRTELLEHYIKTVQKLKKIDKKKFIEYYYGYALIRNVQVFGTYGLRGLYERKEHFLQSIPFAIRNLKWLLNNVEFPIEIPELKRALHAVVEAEKFKPFDKNIGKNSLLTVKVNSFSYKKGGIQKDTSGNGGGFDFDCRFINNPGRYEPYKKLTGRDEPVINFLKHHSKMDEYIKNIFFIVDEAVENYLERSFTDLMVNFGCTGGQHRSVFAADTVAKHIRDKYGVKVVLHHIEMEKKAWNV